MESTAGQVSEDREEGSLEEVWGKQREEQEILKLEILN